MYNSSSQEVVGLIINLINGNHHLCGGTFHSYEKEITRLFLVLDY